MPTASRVLSALAAATLLSVAACRIERAPSGRPPGSTRTAVDSLTRIEQDSASADRVRSAIRVYYAQMPSPVVSVVEADVHTYGDVAQAWVVYRARTGRTGDTATTRFGVDAFNLQRQNGVWLIVHVATTTEDPARPLAVRRP